MKPLECNKFQKRIITVNIFYMGAFMRFIKEYGVFIYNIIGALILIFVIHFNECTQMKYEVPRFDELQTVEGTLAYFQTRTTSIGYWNVGIVVDGEIQEYEILKTLNPSKYNLDNRIDKGDRIILRYTNEKIARSGNVMQIEDATEVYISYQDTAEKLEELMEYSKLAIVINCILIAYICMAIFFMVLKIYRGKNM